MAGEMDDAGETPRARGDATRGEITGDTVVEIVVKPGENSGETAGEAAKETAGEAANETAGEAANDIPGESTRDGGVTAATAARSTVVDVVGRYVRSIMDLLLPGGVECEPSVPGRDGEAAGGPTARPRDGQGPGFAYVIPVIVRVDGEKKRCNVLDPVRL